MQATHNESLNCSGRSETEKGTILGGVREAELSNLVTSGMLGKWTAGGRAAAGSSQMAPLVTSAATNKGRKRQLGGKNVGSRRAELWNEKNEDQK